MPKGTFTVSREFANNYGEQARDGMMVAIRTAIAEVLGKTSIENVGLADPPPCNGSGLPHVLIEMNEVGPKYAPLHVELIEAIAGAMFRVATFSDMSTDRVSVEVTANFRGIGKVGIRLDPHGRPLKNSVYIDPMLEALGTGLRLRDAFYVKRRQVDSDEFIDVMRTNIHSAHGWTGSG